jgi:biopolymer transport protein ExbB/TolQ
VQSSVASRDLIQELLRLPIFHAGWILWLLLGLSLASIAVMLERARFYRLRRVDIDAIRRDFTAALGEGDYQRAARVLEPFDTIESHVVLFGLREHASGPDAVEDLLLGAMTKEKERYDARLDFLATLASNAPFIGLFGTVLGIIRSFKDLAGNVHQASSAVMAGVAEALVATAVGLLVAIPAVVAFNHFKRQVKRATNNAQLLSRVLLAHLKSVA